MASWIGLIDVATHTHAWNSIDGKCKWCIGMVIFLLVEVGTAQRLPTWIYIRGSDVRPRNVRVDICRKALRFPDLRKSKNQSGLRVGLIKWMAMYCFYSIYFVCSQSWCKELAQWVRIDNRWFQWIFREIRLLFCHFLQCMLSNLCHDWFWMHSWREMLVDHQICIHRLRWGWLD